MNAALKYLSNRASSAQIAEHLRSCDADFVPPLSSRVRIDDYAGKLSDRATRLEAWWNDTLVGLVAMYCNEVATRVAYITSVSVVRQWQRKRIVWTLMEMCVAKARAAGMHQIKLEVGRGNTPAIKLYEKAGFVAGATTDTLVTMTLTCRNGDDN